MKSPSHLDPWVQQLSCGVVSCSYLLGQVARWPIHLESIPPQNERSEDHLRTRPTDDDYELRAGTQVPFSPVRGPLDKSWVTCGLAFEGAPFGDLQTTAKGNTTILGGPLKNNTFQNKFAHSALVCKVAPSERVF